MFTMLFFFRGQKQIKERCSTLSFQFSARHQHQRQRALRLQSRQSVSPSCFSSELDQGVQQEVVIETEPCTSSHACLESEPCSLTITKETEIQCELLGRSSTEKYKYNPKAFSFYTGFTSYEHFMFLFHSLGPAAYELNYKCSSLNPPDQLFLTVMKLRCAKEGVELSLMFEISTVSRVFNTWVNFVYFQSKELNT